MLSGLLESMAITVSQLNDYVGNLLENDELLQGLLVTGEISNCKHHSSGHIYFTLKDGDAAIRAVMFRQHAQFLDFRPADGVKVQVGGYVSLYRKEGSYQLYAQRMRQEGLGPLHDRFEALKAALLKEGLFDPAHRKPLPAYPKRIGVITSPTGAVIRDIINVARRRNPGIGILLFPVKVQGDGAAEEIAAAIQTANDRADIDLLIIGRGGGSLEDLWAFNEEIVARAIFASRLLVISAVGHETDNAISDYVADLRAPTPSAAAELAVPLLAELWERLEGLGAYCEQRVLSAWDRFNTRIGHLERLAEAHHPSRAMDQALQRLDYAQRTTEQGMGTALLQGLQAIQRLEGQLTALSPESVLQRGYAIIRDAHDGKVISGIAEATMGREIAVVFGDGKAYGQLNGQVEENING